VVKKIFLRAQRSLREMKSSVLPTKRRHSVDHRKKTPAALLAINAAHFCLFAVSGLNIPAGLMLAWRVLMR